MGGLKTTELYFSQFCGLGVYNQGVGVAGSWWGPTSKLQTAILLLCPNVALILFKRAPPSWLDHLPKVPPPNIIMLGVRISTCGFEWGHIHSDHISIFSYSPYLSSDTLVHHSMSTYLAPGLVVGIGYARLNNEQYYNNYNNPSCYAKWAQSQEGANGRYAYKLAHWAP